MMISEKQMRKIKSECDYIKAFSKNGRVHEGYGSYAHGVLSIEYNKNGKKRNKMLVLEKAQIYRLYANNERVTL